MEEPKDLLANELEITDTLKSHLTDIAKWAKFLSIVGLTYFVIKLGTALDTGFYLSDIMSNKYKSFLSLFISIVYRLLDVAWLFPCIFLYKFSTKLSDSINRDVKENIENAFFNLRSTFKFIGIVAIIKVVSVGVLLIFS